MKTPKSFEEMMAMPDQKERHKVQQRLSRYIRYHRQIGKKPTTDEFFAKFGKPEAKHGEKASKPKRKSKFGPQDHFDGNEAYLHKRYCIRNKLKLEDVPYEKYLAASKAWHEKRSTLRGGGLYDKTQ